MGVASRTTAIHLAILLLLGWAARSWLIVHTRVPARDGVGFIEYARRLQFGPWRNVVRQAHHPPGFPVSILAGGLIAEWLGFDLAPDGWVRVAQTINAAAATLAIVPLYLLGRAMFGPSAGFLAGVMFHSLPVVLQVTSDVLAEGVFLLFAGWSIYWGALCVGHGSWRAGLSCGVMAGASYLARPEGMEPVVATAAALVLAGCSERSWKSSVAAIVAVALGSAPFLAGYAAITGRLSNKPTAQQLFGADPAGGGVSFRGTGGPPLAAFWNPQTDAGQSRVIWAAKSVIVEATHTAHGYGLAAALIGMAVWRRRIRQNKTLWPTVILFALHLIVLWRTATVVGYVSERHAILLVFCASLWCGALFDRWASPWRYGTWSAAVILLLVGWPVALKPLHAQRAGYRVVGEWLATHANPTDEIIDPSAWARFYAGRNAAIETQANPTSAHPRRFIVLEVGPKTHERLHLLPWAREAAAGGQPVFHWPSSQQPRIVVFQVPRPP